jgi:hypothetical protein
VARFLVAVVLAALIVFVNPPARAASPAEVVFQKASPSVVRIEVTTSSGIQQGSAVAIRKSLSLETGKRAATWLVTNAHVVGSASKAVGLSGDKRFEIAVEYSDPVLDIAFLLADADWLPIVEVSTANPPVGTTVFAIGSPRGLTNTISNGIVSGRRDFSGLLALQTSASIAPGSSGGGLFDSTGKLIGITTARLGSPGEALNFALAIGSVKRLEDAWVASQFVEIAFKHLFTNAERSAAKARSPDFIRWLAAPAQDASRKYVLNFQATVPGPAALQTEEGRATLAAKYSEYQQRVDALVDDYDRSRAPAAVAGQQRPADQSSGEMIYLSCRFSRGLGADSNPLVLSFAIDLKRQTVNDEPAEIDDRRIRRESDSDTWVIDRISGVAAFRSKGRKDAPIISGACERLAQKAF